jgi:hypothetical protein
MHKIKIKIDYYKEKPKHTKILFMGGGERGLWSGIHRFLLFAEGLKPNPCKKQGITVLTITRSNSSTSSLSPKLPSLFLSMLPHALGQYFKWIGLKILPPVSYFLITVMKLDKKQSHTVTCTYPLHHMQP